MSQEDTWNKIGRLSAKLNDLGNKRKQNTRTIERNWSIIEGIGGLHQTRQMTSGKTRR